MEREFSERMPLLFGAMRPTIHASTARVFRWWQARLDLAMTTPPKPTNPPKAHPNPIAIKGSGGP